MEGRRLLELALKGSEAETAEIKSLLASNDTGATFTETPATTGKKRRRMSAAARKRISEGMKRRYAQIRKAMKKTK